MADSADTDGVATRASEFEQNESSQLSSGAVFSTPGSHKSDTSIADSRSKHLTMDRDDDGAPSSEPPSVHLKGEQNNLGGTDGKDSLVSFDSSAESTPRKSSRPRSAASTPQTPSRSQDLSLVDMKTSWDGSAASGGSTKGETTDGDSGYKIPFKHRAGMLADPVKIAKEREKEERVRQARERLKEERRRKLEELKEQQRIAQENRERQLEMRRRRIEDLRKRDFERRQAVEERRKMKEDIERARRESILQKAEERVARFEAWKAGGRKGGRAHVLGFGSATPRDICQPFGRVRRSSSHSALQRRSPNGSEMDSVRPQRRALSACSAVRRHCNVYNNRIGTTSTPSVAMPAQRPASVPGVGGTLSRAWMTASMPSPVRMRESKPARKQRPASVASSMPSFVGGEPAKTPRSRSTDRTGRDRSKARPSRKDDRAPKDGSAEEDQKPDHVEDEDKEKDGDGARDRVHKKEKKERVSLSFFDRLSTPKFSKKEPEHPPKETPPKKDGPIIRRTSIREKSSPKEPTTKHVTVKESHRSPAAAGPAGRSVSPSRKEAEKLAVKTSPGHKVADKPSATAPRLTPPPSVTTTPTHGPAVTAASAAPAGAAPSQPSAAPVADDGTTASRGVGGSAQDITAEEYKARLAEKRRQAREKAEKEAEEERKRQELARLTEEERLRQEEEEERRLEEEALLLAENARRAEEERLQRAIEAEEKRRKEEAEKIEQERKIREEAERKAKEENERLEKEKQEKARKEEEERLQRKKKLEMIMKRVKTDTSMESPQKVESSVKLTTSSPSVSQLSSSSSSPEEHEKPVVTSESSDEEGTGLSVAEGSAVESYSADMTMSFMQDFEESDMRTSSSSASTVIHGETLGEADELSSQDGALHSGAEVSSDLGTPSKHEEKTSSSEPSSEAKPKFRSPLLQSLVENKGSDSPSPGPKFKSPLLQNLLGKTKVGARMGLSSSAGDPEQDKTSAASSDGIGGTSKEIFKYGRDEDKDEDTSVLQLGRSDRVVESSQHTAVTNGIGKDGGDGRFPISASKSSFDSSPLEVTKLPISMMSDSALGSSIEQHGDGMMSQSIIFNGHGDHRSHTMEDSSISLYSVEEGVTDSASVIPFDTLSHSERTPPSQDDGQFEELIDLIDSSGKNSSLVSGLPIRAFEESNRRSDVTESVS